MMERKTSLLDEIQYPEDLKKCSVSQLTQVCEELRQFIIDALSENPGHLGASLGTVELTVALHYVLNTPNDRIVWDVGHQAYGHKILTGRKKLFYTNRKLNGISGFPNPLENEYDHFIAGHASNSISAALGMDMAAAFKKEKRVVVAVIGDGAMTGGLAFEGLNNASVYPNNLLIILNDNQYAIDKNIGGVSRYLSKISTSKHYNTLRWQLYLLLKKLGLMNDARKNKILRFSNSIKGLLSHQRNFFEGMDIRYFGPVDGHNVSNLVRVLRTVKDMKGPKILHVCTTKGKGFPAAEKDATKYHAPGRFNKQTGECKTSDKIENQPLRFQDIFGYTLIELAEKNKKIVAITPAMPTGCGLTEMSYRFPDRVFDVGIAEGHAVTFSAGLAKEGMIPYCNIYSSFAQRAYDNIIHDVAILKLPVVLCLDRAGLVGEDGSTHQGAFDLAFLRCIPNLTIASPLDEHEFRNMMYTAQLLGDRPFIIRYPRGKGYLTDWKNKMEEIQPGKGRCLIEGNKLAVLSIGPIGLTAKKVVEKLNTEGYSIALYDFRFVKPMDQELIHEIGSGFKKVITLENNVIKGGFGSAVMEALSENNYRTEVIRKGLPDRFIPHGTVEEQHQLCALDEENIRLAIISHYHQN
ncbi:MAG: 1-deoxy-D-xylulose-5-phosphate synthase [Bacteroidales bacterium]|jgi:1-deoxy-D-xylulose-5-phosphate synthase|nr:1-deoxy-D-xylulose-5-phosphate synthase [Bacteroidota bacterium]